MAFADNLKTPPGVSPPRRAQPDRRRRYGRRHHREQAWPGRLARGSNHLAQLYGAISPEAARKAWSSTPSTPRMPARTLASTPTSTV